MSQIRRVYVEKKAAFAVAARGLLADLRDNLQVAGLEAVRVLARYDVEGLTDEEFAQAVQLVLSEPPVDTVREHLELAADEQAFAIELLPGQYDAREDFAEQCIALLSQGRRPLVSAALVYVLRGAVSESDMARVKQYLINPVEAREAALKRPETLEAKVAEPSAVAVLTEFNTLDAEQVAALNKELGLAMRTCCLCSRISARRSVRRQLRKFACWTRTGATIAVTRRS